jgi:DNA-binding CsgD family transcriptional regulator
MNNPKIFPNPLKISRREKQVLQLIAHEKTSKEIAEQLYISDHTAISHRKNLMAKLKVKNSAGLVRRGFELGILELTPMLRSIKQPVLKSVVVR